MVKQLEPRERPEMPLGAREDLGVLTPNLHVARFTLKILTI